MTVSRRGFLGLVGGFAAVSALPGHGGILEPAVGPKVWIHKRYLDDAGNVLSQMKREVHLKDHALDAAMYVYGLPYWQVDAHSGTYAGLERSALPVFPPEKRFRK